MDFDAHYLRVLKFLNFRPRSEKEVRDYLKKKKQKFPDIDSSLIDLIVHKLKQQKFLNDHDFAKWMIRSRTEFKPKGTYLVRLELRQKGISQEIIDELLQNEDVRSESDKDLAIAILEKKRRKYESMEHNERFAKAGAMLARRGFDLDTIKGAIDRCFGKVV